MRAALILLGCVVLGAVCGFVLLRGPSEEPRTPPPISVAAPTPAPPPEPAAPPPPEPTSRVVATAFVEPPEAPEPDAAPAEPESDEPGPYVRMRLWLAPGEPLPPADMRIYVGAGATEPAVLGASRRGGRWTFPRAKLVGRETEPLTVRVVTNYRPWTARLALPAAPPDEHVDLGDVALVATPLVCAGTVVDAKGEPVVYGQMFLEEPATPPLGALLDGPIPDGTFRYFAEIPPEHMQVRVEAGTRGSRHMVAVPIGATDFRIVLAGESGRLHGRLLVADRFAHDRLAGFRVAVRCADGGRIERTADANGAFAFGDLSPGPARVEIRLGVGKAPLAVLEDVEIPPGATSADPRLDPLDLRGRLHALEIAVVDPDDAPVAGVAAALAVGSDVGFAAIAASDANGILRLLADRLPVEVDLRPTHAGARVLAPRRVRLDAATARVVLAPAFDVRLAFEAPHGDAAGDAVREAIAERQLEPRLVADSGATFDPVTETNDAPGAWRFGVDRPGAYAVRWRFRRWAGQTKYPELRDAVVDLPVDGAAPAVDVRDVETPQRFAAAPNAAAVVAVLR